jgi:hypothetical protein
MHSWTSSRNPLGISRVQGVLMHHIRTYPSLREQPFASAAFDGLFFISSQVTVPR